MSTVIINLNINNNETQSNTNGKITIQKKNVAN